MTTPVVTVRPQQTLHEAARLLDRHRISSMPVVDTVGGVLGVVSEADVVRGALVQDQRAHVLAIPVREGPAATYVADVMTRPPIVVRPGDDLVEAVELMTEARVKALPVVDDGRVVGVISRADVVRQLARRDERVRADLDELVRADELEWVIEVFDGVVVFDGPGNESERHLARSMAGTVKGVTGVRFATTQP